MVLNPLYLITDRNQTRGRPLVDVVKAALDGGVRLVQLREKDLCGKELFNRARELRELTNQYNAKLLINDRVDIAIEVGADGVHLGRQSMPVKEARKAFDVLSQPPAIIHQPLIAVSTHSLQEALQAEADGADFITFGPVYHTPSKAVYGAPVGVDKLKEAARAGNIPIYALGGVKKENIEEVMSAGAYGVAVISAIMSVDDVKKSTEEMLLEITNYQL